MAKKKQPENDQFDFVESVKKKYQSDKEYWQPIYAKALEDARFLSDEQFAQWNEADYNERVTSRRPALTIDQLGQFVHQVVNNIRINTPRIETIPTGEDSDTKTAEAYKGIIKNIEYTSNADNAYDTAVSNSVSMSIGFLRVDHDYSGETGFDQDLFIRRVVNPLSVFLDCNSVEIDGRDAKHATIIDRMTVSEFEQKYPGKEVACFEGEKQSKYKSDDEITVADHYYIEETEKTIAIDDQGNIFDYQDGMPYKRMRKTYDRVVKRCRLSGVEVLEETIFPGRFIPIVPVYGEEVWIDGKRNLLSLIRKSKDAQRMFNYWKSLETELLMKAPQSPFMAAEGQVDDYAQDWLNPGKAQVLRYRTKDLEGNPIPPPQRVEPPTIPVGIVNASRQTVDDIKSTMGIYNASLGIQSNETSGVAINQRKVEGDVATYHFSDNLNKAICQLGRILVWAIPVVYDTARVLTVIGLEDEPKKIGVNGAMAEDQEETIDLKKGRYDVKVIPGANYTTLRQEAFTTLNDLFQRVPDLMGVMGDLYFKNGDFAGAQAMAERMKKFIDPKYLDDDDKEEVAVDPEKQQMITVIQEGQQAIQQMQQEMQNLQNQLQNKQADTVLKAQEIEIKRADLELKKESLAIDAYKAQKDVEIKEKEIEADVIKTRIETMPSLHPDVAMTNPEFNNGASPMAEMMANFSQAINDGLMTVAKIQAEGNQAVIEAITKPKQVIRDETGKIAGVV